MDSEWDAGRVRRERVGGQEREGELRNALLLKNKDSNFETSPTETTPTKRYNNLVRSSLG